VQASLAVPRRAAPETVWEAAIALEVAAATAAATPGPAGAVPERPVEEEPLEADAVEVGDEGGRFLHGVEV